MGALPFSEEEVYHAYELVLPDAEARACASSYIHMPEVIAAMNAAEVERSGLQAGAPGAGDSWGWDAGDELLALLSEVSDDLAGRVRALLTERWARTADAILEAGRQRRGLPAGATLPPELMEQAERRTAALRADWDGTRAQARARIHARRVKGHS